MKQLQRIFKALGNPRRLAIVQLLLDRRELSVGTIATYLKLSITATSKHLGALANIDLLERRQVNTVVYYRINQELPSDARMVVQLIAKQK